MSYPPQTSLPDRDSLRNSAIILIVLGFLCGGSIPAIFGIIALVQMDSDPFSAQRMNKVGWIIFWVFLAIAVVFIVLYLLLFVGLFSIPLLVGT